MAQWAKTLQGLDHPCARLSVGNKQEVGLVQLDPVLDRFQGEIRACGRVQLLDRGTLPPSHVCTPHPPDPVVADQHRPAGFQHVVHDALHGCVPGGGEGEGGGVLGLEDVLDPGLDVIHDLQQ